MKLAARREVAAPRAFVFGRLSDFEAHEADARRRGATIRRRDDAGSMGPAWDIAFDFAGARRRLTSEVKLLDAPAEMRVAVTGRPASGELRVLVEEAGDTVLVTLSVTVRANTLQGRLLLQPLRLGHRAAEQRLQRRLDSFCERIEADWIARQRA